MSKYRPSTLPKGNAQSETSESPPPVRSRAEVKKEWEERRSAEQNEAASTAPTDDAPSPAAATAEGPAGAGTSDEVTKQGTVVPVPSQGEPGQQQVEALVATPLDDQQGLLLLPAARDEHGFVPMPGFVNPASDVPVERLDHYARSFAGAEYAARANEQVIKQQKVITQGMYLLAIKREELWNAVELPDFDSLCQVRFGFGKNYANKLIRSMSVVKALESVTSIELAEKHLRALVPVQERFGDQAVREVWEEALRKGKITEKALKDAAFFLGYGDPSERRQLDTAKSEPKSQSTSASVRVQQAASVFSAVRSLVQTNPEQGLQEARELWKLASELREELGFDA